MKAQPKNKALGQAKTIKQSLIKFYKAHKTTVWSLGVIVLIIFVANSFYLLHFADPNPLLQRSGLTTSEKPGVMSGLDTIDPNNGFTAQALGHQAAEQWLHGHIPYWNHYEGIGSPLAGEMQSQALSPFVLLFHWANGPLVFQLVMEIIAGIATYLFLRRLGLRDVAATIGGLAFALNGTFAWLHNAVFNPIAWLPVILLGFELARTKTERKVRGGWALMAIGIALSLYAGFPETAFINLLFVGFWVVIRTFGLKSNVRLGLLKKVILGGVVGLLLAAPILIAFVTYLPYADVGWHNGTIGNVFLPHIGIPALFMPYIYGPIFGLQSFSKDGQLGAFWGSVGGFYAVSLVFFAILGLFSRKNRTLKWLLVGWITLCLLKTFGAPVISSLVNIIPTLKNAAFYRYAPPSIACALVVLASLGIESLLSKETIQKVTRAGLTTVCMVALIVLLSFKSINNLLGAPHILIWSVGSIGLAIGIVLALTAIPQLFKPKLLTAAVFLVVVGEALGMFMLPQLSTPKNTIDTGPIQFLQQNQGLNRFYTLGPIEPNYGSYYNVASINQNDLPVPKAWSNYVQQNLDVNTSALNFTGNFRGSKQGPSSKAELFRNLQNYEYVGVKYLVAPALKKDAPNVEITADEATANGLTRVYANSALEIFELPKPSSYYDSPDSTCQIIEPTRDTVTATCVKPTYLARKELYIPGWQATVNGKKVTVQSENNLFQKIDLPTGNNTITFSYSPPFMTIAYIAFALGVTIVCLLAVPRVSELMP